MTTALLAEATESVCQSAALGRAGRAVDDEGPWEGFTRWESGPNPGQRIGVSSLQLSGLRCAACSTDIERALLRLPGVLGAQVNAAAQRASVRWDPTRTRISAELFAVV